MSKADTLIDASRAYQDALFTYAEPEETERLRAAFYDAREAFEGGTLGMGMGMGIIGSCNREISGSMIIGGLLGVVEIEKKESDHE